MMPAEAAIGERTVPIRMLMLREIAELGVEADGDVWPTLPMALSRLFERGAAFLDAGASVSPIAGRASPDLLAALNVAREDLLLVEALHLLTRQVTFELTEEGAALEARWLGLADRHLAIRAEIVECRRVEEQLKRELRALGGAAVSLPEHDELPLPDGDRPRKSRGMYEHLFDGASLTEMDLEVSQSSLVAADRVCDARGWPKEWGEHGQLLVLTHGISLALRDREADGISGDDDDSARAVHDAARGRLMGLEGRYSTMRRRLFELRHNNRILLWRITALEVEAQGMRSRLDQFLLDRDRLDQEIAARSAAGAVARAQRAETGKDGWRWRLGRMFRRGE